MDSRFQTLTVVDLAGTYPQESVYLNIPEINKTSNYLKYLVKSLNSSYHSQKPQSLNKNSKIFKELDALVNGHSKLCFIGTHLTDELRDIRIPLMRIKKHKFNKMFIEYLVLQELITASIPPPQ